VWCERTAGALQGAFLRCQSPAHNGRERQQCKKAHNGAHNGAHNSAHNKARKHTTVGRATVQELNERCYDEVMLTG